MAGKIKNSLWLYLLILLLAVQVIFFAAVLSIRDVQARYPQTTRVNTIVQKPSEVISSNCLTSNGTQIVLLGNTTKAEFTLVSEKDATVYINWSVVSNNVSAKLMTDERELLNGSELQLKANEVTTVSMELMFSAEEIVDVIVTCGELSCIFRADNTVKEELPEQEPTEGTEPDEDTESEGNTEPDNSGTESGEAEDIPTENDSTEDNTPENEASENNPTENDSSEETNTPEENSSGENTSEPETTDTTEENEENSPEENTSESDVETYTTPSDNQENLTEPEEPEGSAENTTINPENPEGESGTSESSTTGEDPETGEEGVSQTPTVYVTTIAEVVRTGYIPVVLTSIVDDEITVSMGENHFPAFTRYSTDGGAVWYLLYTAGEISLKAAEKSVVLLDIPEGAIGEVTEITITALQNGIGNSATTAITDIILPENILILSKEYTHLETEQTQDLSEVTVEVPFCWEEPEYVLEMLTEDEDGKVTYIPIIIDEKTPLQIKIENIEKEDGTVNQTITLHMGQDYAMAGTYRLKCNWEYEGICYMQTEIPFFINYSTCSDA